MEQNGNWGGTTEGSGFPSNEREGAFRGTGTLFFSTTYKVDTLFAEGTGQWGGASSYDFGAEKIFWGMPGQGTATRYFGIDESGVGNTLSTIPIAANTTYTLLAMLDFDADLIALWVNPDGADSATTYDVSRTYTDRTGRRQSVSRQPAVPMWNGTTSPWPPALAKPCRKPRRPCSACWARQPCCAAIGTDRSQ